MCAGLEFKTSDCILFVSVIFKSFYTVQNLFKFFEVLARSVPNLSPSCDQNTYF